ncbi:tudor domain-containing 6-like isoform X2 [Montipora foliosa]|uniref:tudor domain-containing 6-like isoform X2 n=1 Tax=Montipora foliosa TaxID=591990 RepID=UPI0035F141A4
MSSSEVDDYFDIPAECNPAKGRELTCKPLWSSAEAHLNPQAQDEVVFLATNSKSSQANPRDKISSKLLKAMELVHQESSPRVRSSGQSEHADVCAVRESGNPELGVLDTWNPMAEDYKSKAFNSYKEPTVIDFVKSFPGNSNQSSQLFANSKSEEGEVKLFVGRIPQQMTQEGLNNLFSQVGKLVSCKLITQHMKDTNIGFVGYSTVHEAETAIQKFDGLDVGQGNRLKVALALTKQKPVYVDHEEMVHTVNGVTDSEERQKETSLEDNVSPSNKAGISYAGKPCNFCGQLGLKWCSVCKIPYCSRECQKHDWPKHKLICLQQASAERKMTNSGTSALLTTTPGDTLQSTEQTQKQTDFSHAPSGLYLSEEHVASKAPWDSEEDTESSAENERDPLRVDGFDVNNVEMFAEMLGFDMSQMKFVEKSQDSDESDKSSSCSLDSSKVQEASSKSPVPATPPKDSPSPHIVNTEQARGLSSGTLTQALITPSVTTSSEQVAKSASQKPSCFEGYKRFFIKELSMEPVPTDGSFEAVVTDVENPSCVWAQLCTPEALERQDQLKTKLQVLYSNSSHEKYVPSVGEVCVAQFSFDSEWYRAKVDIVNNTGTLRVTFIDFGNHEDVTVEKIRRITEDLVAFPRQALKLSLHGIASSCPSGNWSSEATSFLKSKVLSIKCKVQVSRQRNEILFVQLYDPQETSFGATINESLIASGFAKTRERPVSSQNSPQQYSTSQQWRGSPLSPQLNADPKYPEQKRGFHGTERQPVYQASNCQGQVNQIISPSLSGGKSSGSKEFSNLSRNLPGSALKKESFEVIINAIVNPWEFYAQKTNPELVDKLNDLMTDLNKHMSTSSFPLQSQTFSCGQLCAAKFSLDNLWYRAVILEMLSNAVRVRYTDFGNSEVVPSNSISPLPQTFQGFPPVSLRCSLAGITKPKGRDWSVEAVQHFKSLVCGKSFICRIVHQHDIVSIVELQDPEPNREQTVAKSLISAGLADAFFHKDGTKHQLVGKRGSSMMGSQEQVNRGTPEQKGTLNDSYNPPLGFQGFSSNNSGGPITRETSRDNHSDQENPPQGSQSHNAGKESHNHISKTQQNASPPEGQVKKPPVHGLLQSLVFQPAIEKAELPKENSCFDAMLTEVTKMGLFFVQVADHDTAQKLKNLSDDLNAHYRSTKLSFFSPQPNLLCAALFAETGDWCRAMVKGVTADGLVDVYYVDFGNTEKLPVSRIQSLLNKFASVPFFALPCYLANISQPEPPGWSDQAMALIMKKTPLFQCASVRLLEKGCDMLFIDFVISMDPPQSLSELLLNEGLAKRALTCDMEAQQARGIEVCVFEPAVKSVEGLDVFDAMLTDVSSPSSFFIQVLHRDNVESLKQLSADLNAHYTTAEYPPFQAQINKMCAGLFSESNDWCRGFIDGVNSDSSVHVHYLDYGNSELLPCSKVRPLELRFQHPCPMALRCSLTGVFPAHSNSWSHNAKEAFLSQAPLNSLLKVRVVGRESGLLYVDAISPDSPCQESVSHFLISQGLASVNPLLDPSLLSYSGGLDSDIRLYASAVPLVSVPQGMTCRVLISEVQLPDKIFFQVLSKENVQGLLSLSETLHTHCSTVDNVPYKPVLGEVCCAKFIDDQTWYRAVVKQKMSESEMMVVFVDYGNQAVVSVDSIRRITPSFTQLPIQARECFLLNIEPVSGSSWSNDAVAFLKERLTSHVPEPFFAEISNTRGDSLGVKLFEISPDGQPGKSVREEMIQLGLARGQDEAGNSVLPMIVPNLDQFDVVVTEVVHPGEIWVQVVDAEASIALDMLMKDINQYCSEAPMPTSMSQPGQECCAQFSQDCLWYRARVLECPSSEQVRVQFVDFGNSELSSPDKIRAMTDEFFKLPAQALKLSLANICPTHQVWSQEAAQWLKAILNRQLKATVVHRLPEHLVVLLEDWNVPNGPINISQELVNTGYAVNS